MSSLAARHPSAPDETPIGFRFATVAALIRQERYSHAQAEKVVRAWERYARYAMMSGKTPSSTAEHLARFERYQPISARDGAYEIVDEQIAEDLRRHAEAVEDDDPEHARIIHRAADAIVRSPSTRTHDSARIAAEALTPSSVTGTNYSSPRRGPTAARPAAQKKRTTRTRSRS